MSTENIKPEKITKPIQLLAAWLLGLILINTTFLTAASQISKPDWAAGLLIISTVINVPLFLISLFLLQTKFRPEMQEDTYYSKYLERKYNESSMTKFETAEEEKKETAEIAELISKELMETPQKEKKKKIETILRDRDKQRVERRIGESRGLSQLFIHPDKWTQFVDRWKNDSSFIRDIEELIFYQVVKGDINDLYSITLNDLGREIAQKLHEEKRLWNQKHNREIE